MGFKGHQAFPIARDDKTAKMSTLTIQLPDGVLRALESCAAKEGVTVDQLIASAAAEKVSALAAVQGLRERTKGASKEAFLDFLRKSPEAPPIPGDDR